MKNERLPCVQRCIDLVADYYGLTPEWIMADSRSKTRVRCRGLAICLIKQTTTLTYVEIAEELGFLDHSSIYYAAKKFNSDPDFSALLTRLTCTPNIASVGLAMERNG